MASVAPGALGSEGSWGNIIIAAFGLFFPDCFYCPAHLNWNFYCRRYEFAGYEDGLEGPHPSDLWFRPSALWLFRLTFYVTVEYTPDALEADY